MKIILLLLLIFSTAASAFSSDGTDIFLASFIAGKYHVIGKLLNSDKTYYGKMDIHVTEKGVIKVVRKINSIVTEGTGAIETANHDKTKVLRIRFKEAGKEYEETCMIDSDLNNYARMTCYLYRPGVQTRNPGLEAMFID